MRRNAGRKYCTPVIISTGVRATRKRVHVGRIRGVFFRVSRDRHGKRLSANDENPKAKIAVVVRT